MKSERKEKKKIGLLLRTQLLLVVVAAITLEATAIIQYFYAQKEIKHEAALRAESELRGAENKIMDIVNQAEAAVRNNVWVAQWCLEYPDSIQRIPQMVVNENPAVVGSTMALVPGYSEDYPLYAPYAARNLETGNIKLLSLATEEYDYPSMEWFVKPLELQDCYWSEPYFDENGGDILMTTFSMPIKDKNGTIAAILTADISLDWLTDLVEKMKVYPNAFDMIVSRKGKIMVSPVETLGMNTTIDEFAMGTEDYEALNRVNQAMLAGESGEIPVSYKGEINHVFFSPVERTGWSLAIVLPEKELYNSMRQSGYLVKLLQLLGLVMLIIILRSATRNQLKYQRLNEQKERMENELLIARDIQMAMIPKTFPPFPERKDIDLAASIVPAKEVGGDLYDFFIRDEKLFFAIGDVSGKGIPASLVMAMSCSLFRAMSANEDSPAKIVSAMNDSLSETNENSIFVTFFCGVLDMTTGHLRYCNAGHNPPMVLTDAIRMLTVEPNIPLGIIKGMDFVEQEMSCNYDDALFLYTDGLSEAENIVHEQFGESRIETALHGRKSAEAHLENIKQKVAQFVGDAPQSDDLTILFVHYLGKENKNPHRLTLHNDIKEIGLLPEFVEMVAGKANLSTEDTMNLNLALEEAVANVVLYAYPEGTEGVVDIDATVDGKTVSFVITDSGKAFDPTAKEEVDIKAEMSERPIGGLGIHLIRTIMDSVNYERKEEKNILTITKTY